jgi:hypothetical protein
LWILPVEQAAGDLVVAVRKDIGFHTHRVTHNALDGKSPAINFGRYALNCDTAPAFYLLAYWPIWHCF